MSQKSLAFVLRLWRSEQDGQPVWHASLQDAYSEERRVFADLRGLFCFLEAMTAEQAGEGTDEGSSAQGLPPV